MQGTGRVLSSVPAVITVCFLFFFCFILIWVWRFLDGASFLEEIFVFSSTNFSCKLTIVRAYFLRVQFLALKLDFVHREPPSGQIRHPRSLHFVCSLVFLSAAFMLSEWVTSAFRSYRALEVFLIFYAGRRDSIVKTASAAIIGFPRVISSPRPLITWTYSQITMQASKWS